MASVGIGMMVKNEESIITRALDSIFGLADFVLVVDTGSTDDTKGVVSRWLEHTCVNGRILDEPWVDFGHNRSHVLASMRDIEVDYCLMLDADERVDLGDEPDDLKATLTADAYDIAMHRGPLVYPLPRLTRNDKPFFYQGPAHEWLSCVGPHEHATLAGLWLQAGEGGARQADPDRYAREAVLFSDLLEHGHTLSDFERRRYTFYLAQSYRDSEQPWLALRTYLKRAEMEGWTDEVYLSLVYAARLREQLVANGQQPTAQILDMYKRAADLVPTRVEALHGAARLCRLAGLYGEGYAIAKRGVRLPLYTGLFVERWVYDYGLLDEFAVNAYGAGERLECWLACQALLRGNAIDAATRARVVKNAEFATREAP
jgi:hypothetical protein